MNNQQVVLAKRPQSIPQDDVFRFETIETREPHAGEVQVESIYVSVDPYMRGRMNDTKSYVQPFQVNEPLQGHIVGKSHNRTMNVYLSAIMSQAYYHGKR